MSCILGPWLVASATPTTSQFFAQQECLSKETLSLASPGRGIPSPQRLFPPPKLRTLVFPSQKQRFLDVNETSKAPRSHRAHRDPWTEGGRAQKYRVGPPQGRTAGGEEEDRSPTRLLTPEGVGRFLCCLCPSCVFVICCLPCVYQDSQGHRGSDLLHYNAYVCGWFC